MSDVTQYDAPFDYKDINLYNAERSPSTIHSKNTALRRYFQKYLFQEALSVYKWTLPPEWDADFFKFTLFGWGYITVFHTDKFGTVCDWGGLGGYNFYRMPKYVIITNPLLSKSLQLDIGKECEVIKLQPDYSSIMDIIGYYADLMSVSAETMGLNILNVQSATIFGARDNREAESYKKMFDKVASGEPMVVIGKKLLDADGKPSWYPFTQHVKESYVASDILTDMEKIKAQFDTVIGIPNANIQKRERMITDEVNANNTETKALSELWLETLQTGIDKANKMFGLEIHVERRFPNSDPIKKESDSNV